MKRQIEIYATDPAELKERIIEFFRQFDFKLMDHKGNILKFKQKSSFFEGWKTNPLKWKSEIVVSVADKKVIANFCVETDEQMKTIEEAAVWKSFMDNFENYLTTGEMANEKLISTISESRKSRKTYFSWFFLGAITGGLLEFLYAQLTGNSSPLGFYLIPTFATLFLGWRIKYVKTKKAPKQLEN